jgi:hypothetical protein
VPLNGQTKTTATPLKETENINVANCEIGTHVACMGDMRKAYKILVWNSERNRLLARPKRRWRLMRVYP